MMRLQKKLARTLKRFSHQEDGAVVILVAVVLPVLVGAMALVEASRVYIVKNQLQITADAAAMAGVRHIPSLADVRATAIDFAHRNMPVNAENGDVLTEVDVEMGHWNEESRTFTPDAAPANAVRTNTHSVMPLVFAGALRNIHAAFSDAPASYSPEAQAIALLRLDKCYTNGFVAGGIVDMNSQNTFDGGFCVYGRNGVTMNNSNEFAPGTGVGMLDLGTLVEGGNNPGLQEALVQKDISAPAAGAAGSLIDSLIDGSGPIPDYITATVTVSQMPANLVPGTMYIYTGTNAVELTGTVANIGIVSNYSIVIRSNSALRNVVLASRKAVSIRANVAIGDADYCTTGTGASLIVSGGAVSDKDIPVGTNSNIALHGVQVVSNGLIEMNSYLTITGASMQTTQNIVFNSRFDVEGCPEKSPNVTGSGTLVSQLVD